MFAANVSAGAAPLDPPTPEQLTEAKQIVSQMIANPRGPYSRIRWYCNDGTVQPPVAYACSERGGGRQHAEYSPERRRLAELGWSVGTIFASLGYEELFDHERRHQRLRELPLERYLVDIADGWVLRRARDYRGRVQLEDEEAAGKRLLLGLLDDPDWVAANFLLVREAARTIPHGEDTPLARSIRRKAIQLAELDPAAEPWRAEIHSDPNAGTAQRLRSWAEPRPAGDVRALALELADELDELYGAAGRRKRIESAVNAVRGTAVGREFGSRIAAAMALPPLQRIHAICSASADARTTYLAQIPAAQRVALIDALPELDTEVQLAYAEAVAGAELTRADTLALSGALLECAFASGLLSATELASISAALELADEESVTLGTYRDAIGRLKRTPGWAIGTIRHTFAEPLLRYTALDPRAARFSDDLLRGSPMWMLGDTLKVLSRDLDQLSGSVVEIAGAPVAGAVALNSGVANGTLRIFETIEALEHGTLNRSDIVVIPETIAELSPVAGILTLGEGNALSHVQLLARNFGIPNVAIDFDAIDRLKPLQGQRVVMIVSSTGDVLIEKDDAPAATTATAPTGGITVPVPDLELRDVLVLDEIRRDMSGRYVGPKAANLGELNRLFPGRVAPAVAIPFGIYAEHLDAAGLTARIRDAFGGYNAGSLDEAGFNAELASVRRAIENLQLTARVRDELVIAMREQFGESGSYGVFVRSDTNVEDLPQFTGAGLNETIPNIVDFEAQLRAVPRVWSSVLSPRALAWRSSVLDNPEQIYASVLLMQSVPATKSGVLVTRNLYERGAPGLTVSTAWGVGGAVAGEAAETLVITADGVETISEAKSPYRRSLSPAGGVDWQPAPAGRVLDAGEIELLRQLAVEVGHKYGTVVDEAGNPRPWDIEFGFVEGELTLFQIRPLVERGAGSADRMLQQQRPGKGGGVSPDTPVRIDARPLN